MIDMCSAQEYEETAQRNSSKMNLEKELRQRKPMRRFFVV
jgi:hypothetical protein